MLNPLLADPVARVTRDPVRKLGWEDRLIGAIRYSTEGRCGTGCAPRSCKACPEKACRENHWMIPLGLCKRFGGCALLEQKKLCDLLL